MKTTLYILFLLFVPQIVVADFICLADVGYAWVVDTEKGEEKIEKKEITENLKSTGDSEPLAKQRIEQLISKAKIRSVQACLEKHENTADCVANKLAQKSYLLASLDFRLRRDIEETIKQDCKDIHGKCGEPFVSEITCKEKIKPVEVVPEKPIQRKRPPRKK